MTTTNPAFKNINVLKINHRDYIDREAFEREISNHLDKAGVDLIILGGFRRIFSPEFVKKYGLRTMNTHPSLLPAFPGDKAQLKALDGGGASLVLRSISSMNMLTPGLSLIKNPSEY